MLIRSYKLAVQSRVQNGQELHKPQQQQITNIRSIRQGSSGKLITGLCKRQKILVKYLARLAYMLANGFLKMASVKSLIASSKFPIKTINKFTSEIDSC